MIAENSSQGTGRSGFQVCGSESEIIVKYIRTVRTGSKNCGSEEQGWKNESHLWPSKFYMLKHRVLHVLRVI